ncbi:MAG: 4a-hydroxytetrahydrobiopterin dehydratase [Alphaproteobacteria bacterium]|nr:4a-hydroxytetrahydrobiopterin dehydratase [Alphaproteobacteria bacterium]
MTSVKPSALYSDDERDAMLAALPDWRLTDDGKAIEKTFRFSSFNAAFGFMTRVAITADAMDHHPEWANVYGRVDVKLTTHHDGGLTALDERLAKAMDAMASSSGVK